ncbi:MAG: hypothetical protein ABID04_02080, partial [Patescibacteria group bacterium]
MEGIATPEGSSQKEGRFSPEYVTRTMVRDQFAGDVQAFIGHWDEKIGCSEVTVEDEEQFDLVSDEINRHYSRRSERSRQKFAQEYCDLLRT